VACLTVYLYIEQYHIMVKQIIGVTDIYKYIFLSEDGYFCAYLLHWGTYQF
jgi:hypothetical protein